MIATCVVSYVSCLILWHVFCFFHMCFFICELFDIVACVFHM